MKVLKLVWLYGVMFLLLVLAYPFYIVGYMARFVWHSMAHGWDNMPDSMGTITDRIEDIERRQRRLTAGS